MDQKNIDNTFYGSLKIVRKINDNYVLEDLDSNVDRTFYRLNNATYMDVITLRFYGVSEDENQIREGNIVLDSTSLIPLKDIIRRIL
mgnify:FL=1